MNLFSFTQVTTNNLVVEYGAGRAALFSMWD